MTDSPFSPPVTIKQRGKKKFASGCTGHARVFFFPPPTPDTERGCFALGYGAGAVCKVEKNLRKTKVYEWLDSPVAC